MSDAVLAVAAHPDDEILGCGGVMARLAKEGLKVYGLILGEGLTSRDQTRDKDARLQDLQNLKEAAAEASRILGVSQVFFEDLPDNRFDTVPMLDIVKRIEAHIDRLKPKIIFTHFQQDLNMDHSLTCQGVKAASRPMEGGFVKEVLSFSVLSSTEWNFNPPASFCPNVFYGIEDFLDLKLRAMACYKSELREFPHPRSLKAMEYEARLTGSKVGLKAAEAFMTLRSIR